MADMNVATKQDKNINIIQDKYRSNDNNGENGNSLVECMITLLILCFIYACLYHNHIHVNKLQTMTY